MTPEDQPAPEVPAAPPAPPPPPAPLPDDPMFDKENGITRPSPGVRIYDIENTRGNNPP